MSGYVDVHAHLFHSEFEGDEDAAAERAKAAGVEIVIVNGLEPVSNRQTLELCARHDNLRAACGIYPLDAVATEINEAGWSYDFEPPKPFDVDAEIQWIDDHADEMVAIGECGLDQHWVKDYAPQQERVFRALCTVAMKHNKPVILHSRKAEARTFEILQEMGVEKADFHCYCGKLNLAKRITEAGYYISIPPVVVRGESFQRLAKKLPIEQLLTETDSPYMSPVKDTRNEPANVPLGVAAMAAARGISADEMAVAIRGNCRRLFGI